MPEPPITTTATVRAVLEAGRLFEVETKNGLVIPAHITRRGAAAGQGERLNPGDTVELEFTPYDFSKARIAAPTG